MRVGYARVSTPDQKLDLQIDALKEAGCEEIFTDVGSGFKFERKGLGAMLDFVRSGDTVVVYKLDRLGRSVLDLIKTVEGLRERLVALQSISENIQTDSPGGKLLFHVMSSLAEFERDLIRERTMAGMEAARARGRMGGRPKKLSTESKVAVVRKLYNDKSNSVDDICSTVGISRSTLYRYVNLS